MALLQITGLKLLCVSFILGLTQDEGVVANLNTFLLWQQVGVQKYCQEIPIFFKMSAWN